jgi:hypothetical protein
MAMTLQEVRQSYYDFTGKASDIARQLSLAGIAVAWLFKIDRPGGGIQLVPLLLLAVGSFVLSLVLDLIQYVYQAAAWGLLNARKCREGKSLADEVDPPDGINEAAIAFWVAKVGLAILGHVFLVLHILYRLTH